MNQYVCGNCKWFNEKRGPKSCQEKGTLETAKPCDLAPKRPPGFFVPINNSSKWSESFKSEPYDSLNMARVVLNGLLKELDQYSDLLDSEVEFFMHGTLRKGKVINISPESIHVNVQSSETSQYMVKIPIKDTTLLIKRR